MKTLKTVKIENNDVYTLAQSKDFTLINNQYTGLILLDSDLTLLRTIIISNELLIYNIYSSQKDNKIVVSDGENMRLYILDLNSCKNIIQIERKEIFLNWFVSDQNSFHLRDSNYEYCLSYRDGKELSRKPYFKENVLACNDPSFLFEKNNELYALVDNEESKLEKKYDVSKNYSISDHYIIEYDENTLNITGEITRRDTLPDESKWLIRKILIKGDFLTILLNDKDSEINSKLIQYKISSKNDLKKIILSGES